MFSLPSPSWNYVGVNKHYVCSATIWRETWGYTKIQWSLCICWALFGLWFDTQVRLFISVHLLCEGITRCLPLSLAMSLCTQCNVMIRNNTSVKVWMTMFGHTDYILQNVNNKNTIQIQNIIRAIKSWRMTF